MQELPFEMLYILETLVVNLLDFELQILRLFPVMTQLHGLYILMGLVALLVALYLQFGAVLPTLQHKGFK
jgi:hypothetical protein